MKRATTRTLGALSFLGLFAVTGCSSSSNLPNLVVRDASGEGVNMAAELYGQLTVDDSTQCVVVVTLEGANVVPVFPDEVTVTDSAVVLADGTELGFATDVFLGGGYPPTPTEQTGIDFGECASDYVFLVSRESAGLE